MPCPCTRQRGHVSQIYIPGSPVLDQMVIFPSVNTRQTSRGHGNDGTRQRVGPTMALVHAWSGSQRQTHGRSRNMADPLLCLSRHTADGVPTTGARQTGKLLFCVVRACKHTADPLPCPYHVGTQQTVSAVVVTVVSSLPCVRTRQTVCHVQKHLDTSVLHHYFIS
jgi:hypothetical protein